MKRIKESTKSVNKCELLPLSIKITIYMLFFSLLQAKLSSDQPSTNNKIFNQFYNTEAVLNIYASSFKISICTTEQCYARTKQKLHNKSQHTKMGNKQKHKQNKNKKKRTIKLLQINKGSSYIYKHLDLLKILIQEENPGVAIIPESQIKRTDTNLEEHFKGYSIEHKFLPGMDRARISILIREDIEYERLTEIEDDWLSNVWLRVKTSRNGYTCIMGGYREWRHPPELNLPFSGDPLEQESRLPKTLVQVENAKSFSQKLVLGWDSNLDLLEANDNFRRQDTKKMTQIYRDFMDQNDFCLINWEPTRHWSGSRSSLVDHFITNCPNYIDNIQTKHNCIADHDSVSCLLHTEILIDRPQFMLKRNWTNLTRDNLKYEIHNNDQLCSVFAMTSTNKIWNVILLQMNSIINKLAPGKIVQLKGQFIPFMNTEIKDQIIASNEALTEAINTKELEKWRLFRSARNQVYKIIEFFKKEYYQAMLNRTKTLWRTTKLITNCDNSSLPRKVIVNGKTESSPKIIADKMCEFFQSKIEAIRNSFSESAIDPIWLLSFLIPRPQCKLRIPEISVKQTEQLIMKMKCSNTCGHDAISSRILKIMPDIISPFLTHAINTSIRNGIFPDILKISRILPISKKDKSKLSMSSYRPIHNLHTAEKIFEEWIKIHLLKHIKDNEILSEEHHGGLSGHSTMTAKCLIDYHAASALEDDDQAIILSTDLSAAFDTVDHSILIRKLEFYGFTDKEL